MKYFDKPIRKPLRKFMTARGVMVLASGLLGLFLPIFLYELFDNNFKGVVLYYLITSFIYLLLLGFSRFVSRIGFVRSLYIGILFLAVHYIALFFVDSDSIAIFIPIAMLALAIFRFLFWLPFRTDTILLTSHGSRGRQLSTLTVIQLATSLFAPIVSALIIKFFGFNILFAIVIVIYLATSFLFSRIEKVYEKYTWSYTKTWSVFIKHIRDRKLLAYIAEGSETFVNFFVWPVFIFEILQGNLLDVGLVAALITCFTIVLQLIVGKIVDTAPKTEKLLGWGILFYAAGWILKAFVATAFQIFFAGTYHNFVSIFAKTPYQVFAYEIAADQGHYVDEYTVIMEMAMRLGRVLMGIMVFVALFFFSVFWVFIIAAVVSLLINLITKSDVNLALEQRNIHQ